MNAERDRAVAPTIIDVVWFSAWAYRRIPEGLRSSSTKPSQPTITFWPHPTRIFPHLERLAEPAGQDKMIRHGYWPLVEEVAARRRNQFGPLPCSARPAARIDLGPCRAVRGGRDRLSRPAPSPRWQAGRPLARWAGATPPRPRKRGGAHSRADDGGRPPAEPARVRLFLYKYQLCRTLLRLSQGAGLASEALPTDRALVDALGAACFNPAWRPAGKVNRATLESVVQQVA